MKYFVPHEVSGEEKAEVNMSPLIDMVFLLLIFFMVTAVFVRENGVKVNKPVAATAESVSQNSLLITLDRDGCLHYAGNVIAPTQLPAMLKRAMEGKRLPVLILADEATETGTLVRVIDLCKVGGATEVSIAASRKQP